MTTPENYLPEGYPETPPPAHGHPAYLLFAHLLNAITVQPGDAWVPLGQREAAARRAFTVANWSVREALRQAADAVTDLVEPAGIHSPSEDAAFTAGFDAAQNQALQSIYALEERLTGRVKSPVEMAIPDVPHQSS